MVGHLLPGLLAREARERPGADRAPVAGEGLGHRRRIDRLRVHRLAVRGCHDGADRKPYLRANSKSRWSPNGHRHDRAGAVVGEHEVGDPDRHLLARERVDREPPGVDAFLLDVAGHAREAILGPELRHRFTRRRLRRAAQVRVDERVLGREQHEGSAVDRVDAGGEDLEPAAVADGIDEREHGLHAGRPPDPVLLHRQHLLRPVGEALRRLEQLVGVLGDAQEPLLEVARRHLRAATPAGAVDHLLVGEHGLAARAPVHRRAAAVGEALLEHPQEEPLVPAVVLRLAGGELAAPGVADPEPLQLALHVRDVGERPRLGVELVLDRRILGRQAEGVPAERVQDVEALHPLQAGDDVADHVVADVADVRVSGGIREHLEAVELRPRSIDLDLEGAGVGPARLPLLLDGLGRVVGQRCGDLGGTAGAAGAA